MVGMLGQEPSSLQLASDVTEVLKGIFGPKTSGEAWVDWQAAIQRGAPAETVRRLEAEYRAALAREQQGQVLRTLVYLALGAVALAALSLSAVSVGRAIRR